MTEDEGDGKGARRVAMFGAAGLCSVVIALGLLAMLSRDPGQPPPLDRYDQNGSGAIDETEFVSAAEDHVLGYIDRPVVTAVAQLFVGAANPEGEDVSCAEYDVDHSGYLEATELAVAFVEVVEGFVTPLVYAKFLVCPAAPPVTHLPSAPRAMASLRPSPAPVSAQAFRQRAIDNRKSQAAWERWVVGIGTRPV